MRTTNLIANEYQISTNLIKCRVENHFIKERNYLGQYNHDNENKSLYVMNQAELNAMKEEQIRLEDELRKKKHIEEINKKLQEKVKADNLNSKEKLKEIKRMEQEKKTKSEKIKEFDKKIRVRQIKEENHLPSQWRNTRRLHQKSLKQRRLRSHTAPQNHEPDQHYATPSLLEGSSNTVDSSVSTSKGSSQSQELWLYHLLRNTMAHCSH